MKLLSGVAIMLLEIITVIALILTASLIWFIRADKKLNKKLKKLIEKFGCCS